MIKTIIFDFGDVFINLDKTAIEKSFSRLGNSTLINESKTLIDQYETGHISTVDFIGNFQDKIKNSTQKQIITAWNSILLDFPKYRFDFIEKLASENKYQLILLSNTNDLHINWIIENIDFYPAFKNSFDAFYLSHKIHLRKPTTNIFQFVLKKHQLIPSEVLFIDDTFENTEAASALGIQIWNNDPKTEDVIDLFTLKASLF
ncbi:HAD family phosphatase [Aquimarina sp. RZ0]|uniref:HAD family hydrolase n=1 Tax=Aquimarina sp. RZ0 TaxID=2607730 RepID=UPI0011F3A1B3|nr:HAD family phosphatase [Aquimarina sp. RZ0]KAA1247078.1 HAD family phosphatase [Aquimarina sp. RZ0]